MLVATAGKFNASMNTFSKTDAYTFSDSLAEVRSMGQAIRSQAAKAIASKALSSQDSTLPSQSMSSTATPQPLEWYNHHGFNTISIDKTIIQARLGLTKQELITIKNDLRNLHLSTENFKKTPAGPNLAAYIKDLIA